MLPPSPVDLERLGQDVIADVREQEHEVVDRNGHWYLLRMRPYMTLDNRVDGAVLVVVDIDELKRSQETIVASRDYAENIVETVRESLLVLDADLRVERANRAFYRTFQVAPAATIGRVVYELGNGQWNIPRLRELLEEIVSRNSRIDEFQVEHDFENLGSRVMLVNARRLDDPERKRDRILLAIEDVTERARAADISRRSHLQLESHAEELSRFNRVAVGRESRMIDLKQEINALSRRLGEPEPYGLAFDREESSPTESDGDHR